MAKILLIEDDSLVRHMLVLTLTYFDHAVIEAQNGNQGLRLFWETKPDLIITDLVMPEKEGFEILIELRKHRPPVKIIVISGGVRGKTDNYLETARLLGAAKVLAKPFSNDALIAAIDETLAGDGASPVSLGLAQE